MADRIFTLAEACFFDGRPEAFRLYGNLRDAVRLQTPQARVEVKRTQVSFFTHHMFAAVSFAPVRRAKDRPPVWITVTFGLGYRPDSPRVDAAVQVRPGRWTIHVLLGDSAEIDAELLGWLREAAEAASAKSG